MNLHDRIRRELHEQGDSIELHGAGADAVMAAARRRNRRARIVGSVAALALVVGVGGLALALRDDGTSQVATEPGPTPGAPEPTAPASDPGPEPESLPEPEPEPPAPDGAGTGADAGAVPDQGEDPPVPPPAARPQAVDLVVHDGIFVARSTDHTMWRSRDGVVWSQLADPRPAPGATITHMVGYDGSLYVAGADASSGAWLARSEDLRNWKPIAVPPPADDGSALTTATHAIYTLGVGPAGIFLTGETLLDLELEKLIPSDALASGAWSLGDATGDTGRILIYDPATGETVDEIDLRAAGIPPKSIDALAGPDPTAFVALGPSLEALETDLEPGTVLSGGIVHGRELLAAGRSAEFSSRVLWSSTDGRSWTPIPVSVVDAEPAETIGAIGDRLVVFSAQGPLLTVQYRDGRRWREVRLDQLFGAPTDDYALVDASFGPGGVVAVAATLAETGDTSYHLLVSADGATWSVTDLGELASAGAEVDTVDAVAMEGAVVALGYQTAPGVAHTVAVPVSLD